VLFLYLYRQSTFNLREVGFFRLKLGDRPDRGLGLLGVFPVNAQLFEMLL
jgi:hypothetical protein